MKRFLKFLIEAAMCGSALVSCSKSPGAADLVKELILSVDKDVITAGGYDEAIFTVKYGKDNVTAASQICIKDLVCLTQPVFSSEKPGRYEFYATYQDGEKTITSKNTVLVTVVDDFDPSKELHKNVSFFIWTATWCGPCYILKNSLKTVMQEAGGDHIAYVNFYTSDMGDQPSEEAVQSPLTEKFLKQLARSGRFVSDGFPTTVIDFTEMVVGGMDAKGVRQKLSEFSSDPALTGIKVSSVTSDGGVNVTVSVGVKEAGTYYLGILLMEDNIKAHQNGGGDDYLHTNVVRAAGMDNIFGDNIGTLAAGEVVTKDYTFELLPEYDTANLNLMVYTLYDNELGARVMANAVKATADGFTDYQYAE